MDSAATIKDVMRPAEVTLSPADTLQMAAQLMVWRGLHQLPVLEGAEVVGVVSDRDIAARQSLSDATSAIPVLEAMEAAPNLASPDEPLTQVASRMAAGHLDYLLVMDHDRLAGLVTPMDLLAAVVRLAPPPRAVAGPRVRDAMTPDPVTVHPDDYLLDAAARMVDRGVRHLPVTDGDRRVVGMLSDRDLRSTVGDLRRMHEGDGSIRLQLLRVEHAMSRTVKAVGPSQRCLEVASAFADLSVGALVVVGERERLLGILSYVDVLRALAPRGLAPLHRRSSIRPT